MSEAVEAWLLDLSLPAPSAADLAAYVAKQAKKDVPTVGREPAWARDAMMRMANVVLTLHACLQGGREAAKELREERDGYVARLARAHHAMQDAAHTAMMAIEKLQEVQPIVLAALALVKGDGDVEALEEAALAYKKIVESRS